MEGQVESDTTIFAYDERQGVTLTTDLAVDIMSPGAYDDDTLDPGVIPAGAIVNSHLLHFDPVGAAAGVETSSGSVSFAGETIVGIAILNNGTTDTLDDSDFLGFTGTTYPTDNAIRDYEIGDTLNLSADQKSVSVHMEASTNVDQVRIITVVDAVSPLPLVSSDNNVGTLDPLNSVLIEGETTWAPAYISGQNGTHYGVLGGSDWISCGATTIGPADTCAVDTEDPHVGKTTKFRAPFNLADGISNPSLTINVLADNAAAVFVNGTSIGAQTGFGTCISCDATNYNGGDVNSPTPASFSTSNSSHFLTGANILEIHLWDAGGIAGLDYVANLTFLTNDAPVAEANGAYNVDEGSLITLSSSGSSDDVAIVAWDWDLDNNGSFETSGASPTFSAVAIDGPSSQTVVLRVTDAEGETDTDTATVNIANVAPALGISDPNTAYFADWTAANPSTPPGAGTASGVITLADGSFVNVGFEAVGSTFDSAQIGPAAQTAYWADAEALIPGTHISAEVPNLPDNTDILRLTGAPGTEYRVTLSPAVVDPIMLIHSLGNPWNDGTRQYDFNAPFSIVSHNGNLAQVGNTLTGAEGHGTIKFDGTFSTFSWTMPRAEFWHGFTFGAGGSVNQAGTDVDEGQTASNDGTWSDVPGDSDLVLTASVGDVDKNVNGTWNWSFDTTDGDFDSQEVTITANDGETGGITLAKFDITVNNVAPTASLDDPAAVDEGSPATLTFTNQFDPSGDDTGAGFHYSIACDGQTSSLDGTYAAASVSYSDTCTYPDDGTYPVVGRIFDKDDGFNDYATEVTVNNVAPELATIDNVSIVSGETVELNAGFTDPGVLDIHGATVSWPSGVDTVPIALGARTVTSSELFLVPDIYTVTVFVADDDGDSSTKTFTVTVTRAPIDIDVKPGSDVNPLNLNGNGVVPIAVLGNADIDVSTLVVASVTAGVDGDEASPVHGGHLEDVNGDGFTDYVFHFREYQLGVPTDTAALTVMPIVLLAENADGVQFIGQDNVRINPNNPKSKGKGGKGPK